MSEIEDRMPTGAHLRVLPRERYDAVMDSGPTEAPAGATVNRRARRNATDAVNDAMDAIGRSLTEHDLTLILDTFLGALGVTVTDTPTALLAAHPVQVTTAEVSLLDGIFGKPGVATFIPHASVWVTTEGAVTVMAIPEPPQVSR